MRVNDLVKLEQKYKKIWNPFRYLETLAFGKTVLNVGAAGGVKNYLPNNQHEWLHYRLGKMSKYIVGTDIDQDGIDYAKEYGFNILNANCEAMMMDSKFDLIVMSDVIEHVNSPINTIVNLIRHLVHGGALCITTPNAAAFLTIGKMLLYGSPNIYWDHVACYLPEHVQAICDRFGYQLSEIYFFDHIDRRTFSNKIKSYVLRVMSVLYPRFASAFMAIIKNG